MKLKSEHVAILVECRRRMLEYQAVYEWKQTPTGGYRKIRAQVQPPYDWSKARYVWYSTGDWFGASTAAERKRFSRAVLNLESAGLVECFVGPSRTRITALMLTPAGMKLAAELETKTEVSTG